MSQDAGQLSPLATLASVAAATATALFLSTTYIRRTRQSRQLGGSKVGFPRSSPWYLPISIDLLQIIKSGTLAKFATARKLALKADNFVLDLALMSSNPILVVTKPEDQAELMRKEGKMGLTVDMPDTVKAIHGEGNMQSISGPRHKMMRKMFSGLLSPATLERFSPIIVDKFVTMWSDLEKKSANESSETVEIQDAICSAQFYLMSRLFYGLVPDTPTLLSQMEQMRADFESQLQGHFSHPRSAAFKKGLEASKRIRSFLSERFASVLKERRAVDAALVNDEEKKSEVASTLPLIGNAMESIADALIKDSLDVDEGVLSDVIDNLNLLLEASHGTTMTMTTTTMFFLCHPDNADKLRKLREEMAQFRGDTAAPGYVDLKTKMLYAEACIKEAMRMAPIIGSVTYAMEEGSNTTFKGRNISGPVSFMLQFSHNYKDRSIFPDPDKFVPERWIAGSKEEASDTAQMAYKPFGIGRHVCLGYQLAIIVMKASLYCFASDQSRVIEFDVESVKIKDGIFPEFSVSDGLPGKVVTRDDVNK